MIQKYRFEAFMALVCLGFFFIQRDVLLIASLDPDEIFSWNLATGSFSELFSNGLKHSQQFLYYLILKFWSFIFPSNDYWIRIPSLLFGTGTIAALFYLSKKIFKEEHLFFQAALLFLYPQIVFYSTYARPYALLVFLASLNYFFMYKAYFLNSGDKKDLHFFLITLVGVLFTHHIGAIYVVAILVSLLLQKKKLGTKFELMPYQIFAIIYLVQFIKQKKYLSQSVSWIEPMTFGNLPEFIFNNRLYLIFFLFPLVAIGFELKKKIERKKLKTNSFFNLNISVILLFFMGVVLGSVLVTPLFTHRHFYILLPAIFCLSVFGLEELKNYKSFLLVLFLFFVLGGGHQLYKRKVFHGGIADTKTFLRTLKQHVNIDSGFTCVYKEGSFENFFRNYSMQYYNVDICKKYSTFVTGEQVILINLESKNQIKRPPEYSSIYRFSTFEVLKRN